MNKAVTLTVVFGLGGLCGYQLGGDAPLKLEWGTAQVELDSTVEAAVPSVQQVDNNNARSRPVVSPPSTDEVVRRLSVQTPKSQFEGYRALQQLELLSSSAIQDILLSLDESQAQLKGQIAWFFAGKFPEQSFMLMESSIGEDLATTLFANLALNQPQMMYEWLQQHESDFVFMFPAPEQQLERKMVLLQALSVFPDWQWMAYEEGIRLVRESVRPQDKWSRMGLAQTVATANPVAAIDYALTQHQGLVDVTLLNSALAIYAKTDPMEAKKLFLENQGYADEWAVNALLDNLFSRAYFTDAYQLIDSLNDKKMAESVAVNGASKIHIYGSEKVTEFVASIKDPSLKFKAVSAATQSMAIAGYPVEKLLEIMDGNLRDVSVAEKAFSYAWTLKTGYKDNPQSLAAYMSRMKFNNKELAEEVEKVLGYIKDS
ncbi:hypothetical protein [Cellvibrio fontiphilus]|uniref:HEAT repeat domain-containing protein n=1 Tax=Cellvibrio fontiphilus TaxID=1815559 RepID=A0ABV7FDP3_9GAMM